LAARLVEGLGRIDLSDVIRFPEPPAWLNWLMGRETETIPGMIAESETAQLPMGQQQAVRVIGQYADGEALPTPGRLEALRGFAADLRTEIAQIRADLEAMPEPTDVYDMGSPDRQQTEAQLGARLRELELVEQQLAEDEAAANDLATAMQFVGGMDVAPQINTASLDRALDRVRQIAAEMRALNSATPGAAQPEHPRPAGARASGGPVRAGLPYLVNEATPRSEWFVPSVSGGILNVGQAQSVFRSVLTAGLGSGIRPPSMAGLHATAARLRASAMASVDATARAVAGPMIGGAAPATVGRTGRGDVRVELNGGVTINVPSGVTDPGAIADLVAQRIGDRVGGVLSASFSD
jgi:hypothetical protein